MSKSQIGFSFISLCPQTEKREMCRAATLQYVSSVQFAFVRFRFINSRQMTFISAPRERKKKKIYYNLLQYSLVANIMSGN